MTSRFYLSMDKCNFVWGLRYQWDLSLLRDLIPRAPHFVPPWSGHTSTSMFWLISLSFKNLIKEVMQDESYFAFYSFSSFGKENLSPISGAAVAGILPKQLRWKTFQLLWLDDVFASWSSTTSKRQKLSCNLFHSREYFRPLARLKHSEILKWSNSWND